MFTWTLESLNFALPKFRSLSADEKKNHEKFSLVGELSKNNNSKVELYLISARSCSIPPYDF